jgi:hypothetical protein
VNAPRLAAAVLLVFACSSPEGEGTASSSSSADDAADDGSTSASTSDGPVSITDPGESSGGVDSTGGGADSSGGGSTTGTEGLVPMFVAQGMLGRTTISCDDGMTWVADRSWDTEGDPLLCGSTDPIRCDETACQYLDITGACATSDPCDCGHNPGFSKGIAYGDGWFVATWGWGHPGSVRRSRNGIDWEETLAGEDAMFGGLVYGAGRFVLSSRYPYWSDDGGATWTAGEEADFRGPNGEIVWSVRRLGFADFESGTFVATANPPQDVLVSKDGGASWVPPSSIDDACLSTVGSYGGIATGNGVVVGVGDDGTACRSTDGGDTWTLANIGGEGIYARVLWTGAEFVAWSPGTRYASADGETWQPTPMTPEGVWLGAVAQSEATGTFAAAGRVWDAYENQSFWRSTNGIDWEQLPEGAFEGGHYIFEMAAGWAEPSELCPL